VTLRTYTPVEEVAQCWQTSLAVPVALSAPEKTRWRVRHERGDELLVHREGSTCWARLAEPREPVTESSDWPTFAHAAPASDGGPAAQVLREVRSRLYLRCADAAELAALELTPADVLRLCARSRTNGLVLSASQPDGTVRVRVFTTSLGGHEDSATGGAVLGVGLLAAGRGVRGNLVVRQGPPDPARQGYLRLRLDSDTRVVLGGDVLPLMRGRLVQP
jgi:predicted PhzF superfamily epimerase YddE/YHI9